MQTYTSAGTSINSARLPAVFGKIRPRSGEIVLDYGCGKYTEHIRSAIPEAVYMPYDPYNQPDSVNMDSLQTVADAIRSGCPVTVVCSNVLNVIDSDEEVMNIAGWILYITKHTGGTAYITVYEGNRSGSGRQTGPDQYQRNQPLREYLKYFPGAQIRSGMIVTS